MLHHPATSRRLRSRSSRLGLSSSFSNHTSNGSRAAASARRCAAWRSFCRVVPLAAAISAQVAPSRRAASINKISARDTRPTACRRVANSASGRWGPRDVALSASDALTAIHLAADDSGVLTDRRVAFLDGNRNCRRMQKSICDTTIYRRAFAGCSFVDGSVSGTAKEMAPATLARPEAVATNQRALMATDPFSQRPATARTSPQGRPPASNTGVTP